MNIGMILPSLEIGQLAYEINTDINKAILAGGKNDYRIFFENLAIQCVRPLCAVMNISEIWHFDGVLISTDLESTEMSLQLRTNVRRILFLWDAWWLRAEKNYLHNLAILRDPRLFIIVRSEDIAKALDNYVNRKPDKIMQRLNFMDLTNES